MQRIMISVYTCVCSSCSFVYFTSDYSELIQLINLKLNLAKRKIPKNSQIYLDISN